MLTFSLVGIPLYFAVRERTLGLDGSLLAKSMNSSRIVDATGVISLKDGLRVACISGIDIAEPEYAPPAVKNRLLLDHTAIDRIQGPIDVLFSVEWPFGVTANSKTAARSYFSFGSTILTDFVCRTRPFYIISIGEDVSWSRESFMIYDEQPCQFISLSNSLSENGFLTLTIPPEKVEKITTSPFVPSARPQSSLSSDYVCRICNVPGHHISDCPRQRIQKDLSRERTLNKKPRTEHCWFCLANPQIKRHLIVDIGSTIYIALAHGALSDFHLLIIPIEHVSGTGPLPDEVNNEILNYQQKLRNICAKEQMVPIFFVLQQNPNHHWHMTCMSINQDSIEDFERFLWQRMSELKLYPTYEKPNKETFFNVATPRGTKYLSFEPQQYFPVQLARQLMVEFLRLDRSLLDWRNSTRSEKEETLMIESIRQRFY